MFNKLFSPLYSFSSSSTKAQLSGPSPAERVADEQFASEIADINSEVFKRCAAKAYLNVNDVPEQAIAPLYAAVYGIVMLKIKSAESQGRKVTEKEVKKIVFEYLMSNEGSAYFRSDLVGTNVKFRPIFPPGLEDRVIVSKENTVLRSEQLSSTPDAEWENSDAAELVSGERKFLDVKEKPVLLSRNVQEVDIAEPAQLEIMTVPAADVHSVSSSAGEEVASTEVPAKTEASEAPKAQLQEKPYGGVSVAKTLSGKGGGTFFGRLLAESGKRMAENQKPSESLSSPKVFPKNDFDSLSPEEKLRENLRPFSRCAEFVIDLHRCKGVPLGEIEEYTQFVKEFSQKFSLSSQGLFTIWDAYIVDRLERDGVKLDGGSVEREESMAIFYSLQELRLRNALISALPGERLKCLKELQDRLDHANIVPDSFAHAFREDVHSLVEQKTPGERDAEGIRGILKRFPSCASYLVDVDGMEDFQSDSFDGLKDQVVLAIDRLFEPKQEDNSDRLGMNFLKAIIRGDESVLKKSDANQNLQYLRSFLRKVRKQLKQKMEEASQTETVAEGTEELSVVPTDRPGVKKFARFAEQWKAYSIAGALLEDVGSKNLKIDSEH